MTEAAPEEAVSATAGAGRSTAIFAAWTAVSRVAGLIREIAAAALYGTKGPIAAFVVAFQVPNLLRSLVADAALSAAFVPIFTELDEQGRKEEAGRLAGAFFGLITLVLGLISLLAVVTAPWVMPLFAPGLSPALQDDLVRLSQIMFPIVVLLGLTGLVMGILQANNQFTPIAFAPVLWNVVIIIGLVGVTPLVPSDQRIYVYAVGILLGTVVQFVYLLPFLRGKGPFPLSIGRHNPHVRRVLVLMIPVTIGLGLINFTLVINTYFAARVSDDSVRAIDAAFRLYILPQGIFSVAVSTVLFPAISRLAARGDVPGMRRAISDGTRLIFFLLIPATVFLALLAEPVTQLVFEYGQFDAAATSLTSTALLFFTVGLVFNGASLLLIRAFFSLKQPWVPTKVAVLTLAVNIVLDLVLSQLMGTGGIPLATSIASFVGFVVLAYLLEQELGGLEREWLLDGFVRTAIAAVWLGALSWATWDLIDQAIGHESVFARVTAVGAAMIAGVVAYLTAAQGMSLPEVGMMARVARSLR